MARYAGLRQARVAAATVAVAAGVAAVAAGVAAVADCLRYSRMTPSRMTPLFFSPRAVLHPQG